MSKAVHFSAALISSLFLSANTWAASFQVTDANANPIAGASISLIDTLANKPIKPRPITTGPDGRFEVSNKSDRFSFYIQAEGFVPSSFLNVSSNFAQFQLNVVDSRNELEIQGQAIGFGDLKKDGKVDFGLVYPALLRRDFVNFQADTLISPYMDTIKVVGQKVDLPSNLTIPRQKENYILPITLKKPDYRMYVKTAGDYKMIATHGQFPLRQVISDIQGGKSVFELINQFSFKQAGSIDLNVEGSIDGQDIDVSQIQFDATTNITAPELADGIVFVAAVAYNEGRYYYATDLKNIASGETKALKLPSVRDNEAFVLSVLTKKQPKDDTKNFPNKAADIVASSIEKALQAFYNLLGMAKDEAQARANEGEQITLSLEPLGVTTPSFLGLIEQPDIRNNKLVLQLPANDIGVTPVATHVRLVEVELLDDGKTENSFRIWEVMQPEWITEVSLHENGIELDSEKNYRWEVMYLGTKEELTDDDTYLLDKITHVSRNSRNL